MNTLTFEATVTAEHQLYSESLASLPVGCTVKVTVEPVVHDPILDHYQPRTEIGRRALEARRAYIEGGGKLMTQDELLDYMHSTGDEQPPRKTLRQMNDDEREQYLQEMHARWHGRLSSSEEFAQRKQEEIDLENRRWNGDK
ncbi:hypothetical protein CCP4SC76_7890006 [Gammaproteobacteria bacterium]